MTLGFLFTSETEGTIVNAFPDRVSRRQCPLSMGSSGPFHARQLTSECTGARSGASCRICLSLRFITLGLLMCKTKSRWRAPRIYLLTTPTTALLRNSHHRQTLLIPLLPDPDSATFVMTSRASCSFVGLIAASPQSEHFLSTTCSSLTPASHPEISITTMSAEAPPAVDLKKPVAPAEEPKVEEKGLSDDAWVPGI